VVDDDEDIRVVLGTILGAQGYEVATAADGIEALEQIRRTPPPSLILLDMMMPRLDGSGVVRALRPDPLLSHIPVVMISGDHAIGQKAAQLGISSWLVKPIELEQLMSAVLRASATIDGETLSP
jgi:CheY-like chemotaxis protein